MNYNTSSFNFSFFTGFGDRLLSEVKKLAPKDIKIRVCMLSIILLALNFFKAACNYSKGWLMRHNMSDFFISVTKGNSSSIPFIYFFVCL